jgi:antitoxin ParD1/3/4
MVGRAFGQMAMAVDEQLTVTVPAELARTIRAAVAHGDYASSSDVVRDALAEWARNRDTQAQEHAALKSDIDRGLADLAAGRVVEFDAERIAARGRQASQRRSR